MEKNKKIKISLSTFFLIIALILIILMAYFIYKIYNDKEMANNKVKDLNTQVSDLKNTVSKLVNTVNKNEDNNQDTKYEVELDSKYVNNKYGIRFEYPSTFTKTTDTFESSAFEAIEDSNKNRFQVQMSKIETSMTLKDIVKEEKEKIMPDGSNFINIVKDEKYVALNENKTSGYIFECTTGDDGYQIIFVTQKENTAYLFTFTIDDKTQYNKYEKLAYSILNTIIVE